MGKWTTFSPREVTPVTNAISELLDEYGLVIYEATSLSMDAAANEAIRGLKEASPKKTGRFKRNWKAVGSGRFRRYVGNTTTVPYKRENGREEEISLANILEYSTTHGKPFIKKTIEANAEGIARAAIETMIRNI